MDKRIFSLAFVLILSGLALLPTDSRGVEIQLRDFGHKNFAGGRVGVWTGTANKTAHYVSGDSLTFSGSSLYAEFFYAKRIVPSLSAELCIGIFSRGDFRYYSVDNVLVGSVNIYPFLLSAKLYPFASIKALSFYPYVQVGGGVVYGRQNAIDYYYGVEFTNASQTKLTYVLGGGIDWPVADQIGLCANFKYIPAKFGKPLSGVRDYSGWEISFGAGYIFGPKGK